MQGRTLQETPQSVRISERGIETTSDLAEFYTGLLNDIVCGHVLTEDANVACKTGDKIIRLIELEHQHGAGEAIPIFKRRTIQGAQNGMQAGPKAVGTPSQMPSVQAKSQSA